MRRGYLADGARVDRRARLAAPAVIGRDSGDASRSGAMAAGPSVAADLDGGRVLGEARPTRSAVVEQTLQLGDLLLIDLNSPAPIPAGTLTLPDGSSATFDGWLQLLAVRAQTLDALPDAR